MGGGFPKSLQAMEDQAAEINKPSLPAEDLGGNEIGLKKGGRVDETELNAGENEEVARRTARRLELFGSTLEGVRFKSDG